MIDRDTVIALHDEGVGLALWRGDRCGWAWFCPVRRRGRRRLDRHHHRAGCQDYGRRPRRQAVLSKRGNSAKIHPGLGFIWGIPGQRKLRRDRWLAISVRCQA
jgi:hypothetical protein